jgi:Holliday junction resolvasome RuvABC endonuclease subunit
MIIGVDAASVVSGVALVRDDGVVLQTWAIEAAGREPPIVRLHKLAGELGGIADDMKACQRAGERVVVAVEDRVLTRNSIAMILLGEARGIVYATAWARGWVVEQIAPRDWKQYLSAYERAMPKDSAYVTWFNNTRRWTCRRPDEVDAALIAQAVAHRLKSARSGYDAATARSSRSNRSRSYRGGSSRSGRRNSNG